MKKKHQKAKKQFIPILMISMEEHFKIKEIIYEQERLNQKF